MGLYVQSWVVLTFSGRVKFAGGGFGWGRGILVVVGAFARFSEERSMAASSVALLASGRESRRFCGGRTHPRLEGGVGVGAHGGVDEVGQFAFEAAQGFTVGLAGGAFAVVVGPAFGRRGSG